MWEQNVSPVSGNRQGNVSGGITSVISDGTTLSLISSCNFVSDMTTLIRTWACKHGRTQRKPYILQNECTFLSPQRYDNNSIPYSKKENLLHLRIAPQRDLDFKISHALGCQRKVTHMWNYILW